MDTNARKKFEELEKLNAQIDVWIDEEDYKAVEERLNVKNEGAYLDECFNHPHCTSSPEVDKAWKNALSVTFPVIKAGDLPLRGNSPIDRYWSRLFYAKLLRARIQQRGTDCYFRRLDDVMAYLERHLPQIGGDATKLLVIYLLELSAASESWGILAFAERARRVIIDAKRSPRVKRAIEKAPYEFYELWARYNIGVAYFHQGYYRKAVLEFNKVIWQVEKWGESTETRRFFNRNNGKALLYLRAILYRADVQLKLQFAYHTLDTLNRYFWNNKGISSHKKISAMIIEAQAYQQMGRLDKSWGILDGNEDNKVKEKQEGICKLVADNVQLGQRTDCIIPERDKLNQRFPGLGERFIDILIADHLDWLTFRGGDSKQPPLKLTELVRRGDAEPDGYLQAVKDAKSYLNKLVIKAFSSYFEVVEHHAYNRSGYSQQLAKYLAWLAKATDLKYNARDSTRELEEERKEKVKEARSMIASIARSLYSRNKEGLLFEEDKLDRSQNGCRYCQAKGIDLRRIESEHYTWFTEDILEFFNSKDIFKLKDIGKDKKGFVERLIKREWKDRDDLRIRDLKLRYEYNNPEELLKDLLEDNETKRKLQSSPHEKYAEWLCWKEQENKANVLDLLRCKQEPHDSQEDDSSGTHLIDSDYIKLMQDWDKSFLAQLGLPSVHKHQESGFHFLGLQRWNSASPAKGFSVGGGYLLYHLDKENKKVDMGIAIDPGFDFVRNLFHMGFSLYDIDIVLLSHAHLDHIRDFESIVMLLSELKKRDKRERRVHVILSLGLYKRLEHIVEDPGFRYFMEPYIIDVEREINDDYFEEKGMQGFSFRPVTNGEHVNLTDMERLRAVLPGEKEQHYDGFQVTITPTRAYHDDKTRSDSFGFVVELTEKVKESGGKDGHDILTFGYTGDTKWVYPNMPDPLEKDKSKDKRDGRIIEDIANQYRDCDVLLVHLGSLISKNDDGELSFDQYNQCGINAGNRYRCEELVREKDHPYLVGMLRLLSSLYENLSEVKRVGMPLVLVGEFGEELRGTIRSDFIQRLQGIYKNGLAFLPVDVGLNVYLRRKGDEQDNSCGNRCACRVWCVQCNRFVNIGDADYELYGADHALYCVCKTCKRAVPLNVLQDRLRQLYEVGLELRPYESK